MEEDTRTACCALGLFCTAVPATHTACVLMASDEDEAMRSCIGVHICKRSRSACTTSATFYSYRG